MSDPEFIRNTSPHEIAMPVGGRNAMGKSAQVGEPTIHRVLAEDDAYTTAPSSPAENWTATDTAPPQPKAATLAIHETANPVLPAEDKHTEDEIADTPVPQASEHTIAVAPDLKAQMSDELALRLTALKAENNKVSDQLDDLETLMGHQP